MKTAYVIGRAIFGGFFIYGGVNHLLKSEELTQYAKYKNLPMPDVAVKASGLVLIAGGASLVLGLQPRIGAAAVLGFLAVASPTMHDFWSEEDAAQRQNSMIHFSKNTALAAAALALLGVPDSDCEDKSKS